MAAPSYQTLTLLFSRTGQLAKLTKSTVLKRWGLSLSLQQWLVFPDVRSISTLSDLISTPVLHLSVMAAHFHPPALLGKTLHFPLRSEETRLKLSCFSSDWTVLLPVNVDFFICYFFFSFVSSPSPFCLVLAARQESAQI